MAITFRGPLAPGYCDTRPAISNKHRPPSALRLPPSALRRGFTLIEMMIVIAIILILVGATAVLIQPPGESRRIREAARAVNIYLSSARNRAMESGRPCGVIFRHLNTTTACALNADQCEVPPCYAGDLETSTATIKTVNTGGTLTLTFSDGDFTNGMLRAGDLFQLNGQGVFYTVAGTASNTFTKGYFLGGGSASQALTVTFDTTQGQMVPWAVNAIVSYRIARSPTKSVTTSLQLPSGSVVDLDASGMGTTYAGANDYTILFSPTGAVDCVYVGDTRGYATEPIYLLIGKRDRVGADFKEDNTNDDTMTNWQNLYSFWVTVNPQTGVVSTELVAAIPSGTAEADSISKSRVLAAEAQGSGGR